MLTGSPGSAGEVHVRQKPDDLKRNMKDEGSSLTVESTRNHASSAFT